MDDEAKKSKEAEEAEAKKAELEAKKKADEEAEKQAAEAEEKKRNKSIKVIWTKNVRHTDGKHRKGDKSTMKASEAEELLKAGVIKLPE